MTDKFKQILQLAALVLLPCCFLYFLNLDQGLKDSQDTGHVRTSLAVPEKLQRSSRPPIDVENKVIDYSPDKSFSGFTLYPQAGTEKIHLLNMKGESVHSWDLDVARARLLPDCSLLVVHGSKWGLKRSPWRELRANIRYYDWDGKILKDIEYNGQAFHHDVNLTPAGNLIAVQRELVPLSLHDGINNPVLQTVRIKSDRVVELDKDGQAVWEWAFHNHLDLNSCGKYVCPQVGDNVLRGSKPFDWSHVNSAKVIPENKWYADGDKRFKPGNILLMPRNWSTAMIIDKDSKGVVWRFTGKYKGGLQYGHEVQMIEPDLPGAGNILIFDNGVQRRYSVILEINPVTMEPVWVYDVGKKFYSAAAGSVQRLPNGNTLISEDLSGRLIEVTPEKEVVWQYLGEGVRSARATRYTMDYCEKFKNL